MGNYELVGQGLAAAGQAYDAYKKKQFDEANVSPALQATIDSYNQPPQAKFYDNPQNTKALFGAVKSGQISMDQAQAAFQNNIPFDHPELVAHGQAVPPESSPASSGALLGSGSGGLASPAAPRPSPAGGLADPRLAAVTNRDYAQVMAALQARATNDARARNYLEEIRLRNEGALAKQNAANTGAVTTAGVKNEGALAVAKEKNRGQLENTGAQNQGKVQVAGIHANSARNVASIAANSRENVARIQQHTAATVERMRVGRASQNDIIAAYRAAYAPIKTLEDDIAKVQSSISALSPHLKAEVEAKKEMIAALKTPEYLKLEAAVQSMQPGVPANSTVESSSVRTVAPTNPATPDPYTQPVAPPGQYIPSSEPPPPSPKKAAPKKDKNGKVVTAGTKSLLSAFGK